MADQLAERMECEVQPGDNSHAITMQGKGYHVVVAPFFGGWQATLHLPNHPPSTYYAEAADMLELRLKAKLAGRPANF